MSSEADTKNLSKESENKSPNNERRYRDKRSTSRDRSSRSHGRRSRSREKRSSRSRDRRSRSREDRRNRTHSNKSRSPLRSRTKSLTEGSSRSDRNVGRRGSPRRERRSPPFRPPPRRRFEGRFGNRGFDRRRRSPEVILKTGERISGGYRGGRYGRDRRGAEPFGFRPAPEEEEEEMQVTEVVVEDKATTLNERFSEGEPKFVADENITVGIERNIRGNSPVRERPYDASQVSVKRRKNEGETPLSKRAEFKTQPEAYSERRTIKVTSRSEGFQFRDNFAVDRQAFRKMQEESVESRTTESVLRALADGKDDRDLRSDLKRQRQDDLRWSLSGRVNDSSVDLNLDDRDLRQRLGGRENDRYNRDRGDELTNRRGELPDFSSRPEKYRNFVSTDPSDIPKGMFFQHDNREADVGSYGRSPGFQGRGRGRGFRGREFRRGRDYRGRSNRDRYDPQDSRTSSRNFRDSWSNRGQDEGVWKHDKFNDLQSEEPSSTTSK